VYNCNYIVQCDDLEDVPLKCDVVEDVNACALFTGDVDYTDESSRDSGISMTSPVTSCPRRKSLRSRDLNHQRDDVIKSP